MFPSLKYTGMRVETSLLTGSTPRPVPPLAIRVTSLNPGSTDGSTDEFPTFDSEGIIATATALHELSKPGAKFTLLRSAAEIQIAGHELRGELVGGLSLHRSAAGLSLAVTHFGDVRLETNPELAADQAKAARLAKDKASPHRGQIESGLALIGKFVATPESVDWELVDMTITRIGRLMSDVSWKLPQAEAFMNLMKNIVTANYKPRDNADKKHLFGIKTSATSWLVGAAKKTGQINQTGRFFLSQLSPTGQGTEWHHHNFMVAHALTELNYAPAAAKLTQMAQADHGNADINRYAKLVAGEALINFGRIDEGRKLILEGLEMTLAKPVTDNDLSEFVRVLRDKFPGTFFKDFVKILESKGVFTTAPQIPEFEQSASRLLHALLFTVSREEFDGLVRRILTGGEDISPALFTAALQYDVEGWI